MLHRANSLSLAARWLAAGLLLACLSASAQAGSWYWVARHGDVGAAYDPDADPNSFDMHIHLGNNARLTMDPASYNPADSSTYVTAGSIGQNEFAPREIITFVADPPVLATNATIAAALGINLNDQYWFLPTGETNAKPNPGIASEELAEEGLDAFFPGGIDWSLVDVQNENDGVFALYNPVTNAILWSSLDGDFTSDTFNELAGAHSHYQWLFSATGLFEVTIRTDGLFDDGATRRDVSGTGVYLFQVGPPAVAVIPEPSSLVLAGLGIAGALVARRHRRKP